jgi:hypothetical protein
MFNNLAALNSFTPYTIDVAFQAQSVAAQTALTSQAALNNMGCLSIFGTTVPLGTSIPFMSIGFPIFPSLAGGALLGTAAIPGAL